MKTTLSRFRLISILEGISFLVLVFIAMPLKYLMDIPEPVKYAGWVHGGLFISLILGLFEVTLYEKWNIKKVVLCFVCALIPFGPFYFDKKLKEEMAAKS